MNDELTKNMKGMLVTIDVGRPMDEVSQISIPTLDRYARRHGLALVVERHYQHGNKFNPDHPHWQKLNMISAIARSGAYDFALYVDCDIVIHPEAPMVPIGGVRLATDPLFNDHHREGYLEWAQDRYAIDLPNDIPYYNTGVISMTRPHAERWAARFLPPFHDGIWEQHFLNLSLYQGGVSPALLDRAFNWSLGADKNPPDGTWFAHACNVDKVKELTKIAKQWKLI